MGHQISRIKSSYELFCALIGNLSHFLRKFNFLLFIVWFLGHFAHTSSLTKIILKMKKWSSQWTQFMQLRKEAWKKFRTSTGFEPVTSRYWCNALPTERWSHWRWEQVNCGFICSRERNECKWYMKYQIWPAEMNENGEMIVTLNTI